jgi:hypothetical protein
MEAQKKKWWKLFCVDLQQNHKREVKIKIVGKKFRKFGNWKASEN